MAWLETEPCGYIHIAFRVGTRKFKKSLRTKDQREAQTRRHRLEENLRLVESGRLSIPENCDVSAFLLSDGKLTESTKIPETIVLGQLFESYSDALPEDTFESESIRIAGIHMKHVTRILGVRRTIRSVSSKDIQLYVTERSKEPGKNGRVSVGTIKKELSTFSSLWTWCQNRGLVSGKFPKEGVKYPKQEEKPPFQTWSQIKRQIELEKSQRSRTVETLGLPLPEPI